MIEILEYNDKYKNDIIQMILEIQQQEYSLPITEDDQPDLKNITEFYQQNNGNFWVALYDNNVVGTVAIKNLGNGNAVIRKMFVKRELRGKDIGVSLSLLMNLFEWSKEKNFYKLYLGTTPQFLAAHRFYEKNGFIEIKAEDLPSNFPIMDVDKKFYCYSNVN